MTSTTSSQATALPTGERSPLRATTSTSSSPGASRSCGRAGRANGAGWRPPRKARSLSPARRRVEGVELRCVAYRRTARRQQPRCSLARPTARSGIAWRAAKRKLPDGSATDLATLDGQLRYFDLRELQDAIASKSLWPRFEPTFRPRRLSPCASVNSPSSVTRSATAGR